MTEHLIFLFYIILFSLSIIGHGEIFARFINRELLNYNIGFIGLIGFFSISLISLLSSYFFSHNIFHNTILHILGFFGFLLFFTRQKKNKNETKYFFLLLLVLLIGSYVYKNHDDFPYYHLTYSLNLSENKFIIGTGSFSHGFRTLSSIFYFNSILYMPIIKFYLFHIGPFFILSFFNYIIIENLFKSLKENKQTFLFYFKLLSLIFVDVAFYRISEHGTDRSAQILLILIFLFYLDIIFFENDEKKISLKLNLFLIIIFMASSMKAIYYMYLILVPVILVNKNYILKFFRKKNILLILILSLSLSGNLLTSYFSTGCFLYPAEKTCIGKNSWSVPKKEVKTMKTHYEWWSKAGGGPGYKSKIKKEIYVKDFNWIKNWIDRYFFNKVLDTLLGIIFICVLILFIFKLNSQNIKKNKLNYKQLLIALIFPIIFLIEWFLNHPAMRYGGYVLIGLPLFLITSFMLQTLDINRNKLIKITGIFVTISLLLFFSRNVIRLNKEVKFYKYDIFHSPYFNIEDIETEIVYENDFLKIYSPKSGMCWASKTPCSYSKNIKSEKFFGLNVVYRDNE